MADPMDGLQLERLRRQIRYCYDRSPGFYRPKLDALGVHPEEIRTWADFRRLPALLTKADERLSQEASLAESGHPFGQHLCCRVADLRCICSTSGTTGAPTYHLYSQRDLATTTESWFRVLRRAGVRPGQVAVNLHGLSMTALGWPVLHALQQYGAAAAPIGAEARSERILHYLDSIRPQVLFGTAALVEYLIDKSPEVLKKPVGDLGITRIICTGAPGAGVPEVRRRIQESYGARLFDAAGGSQGIHNLSCPTEPYQGMHVLTRDLGIWCEDLVDPATGAPVEFRDGAVGAALLTSLWQEAAPALKFALGDILQVFTGPCPCGRPGYRIRIVGRADEMLSVLGVNLHPTAVWDLVTRHRPLTTGELRIVLTEPGLAVRPPVPIVVEHGPGVGAEDLPHLRQRLEEEIHVRLRVRAAVELVPPGSLERAAGPAAKGKWIERRHGG